MAGLLSYECCLYFVVSDLLSIPTSPQKPIRTNNIPLYAEPAFDWDRRNVNRQQVWTFVTNTKPQGLLVIDEPYFLLVQCPFEPLSTILRWFEQPSIPWYPRDFEYVLKNQLDANTKELFQMLN